MPSVDCDLYLSQLDLVSWKREFTESSIQLFYLFLGNTNPQQLGLLLPLTDFVSQMTCSKKYLQNSLCARTDFQDFLGSLENGTPTARDRIIVSQPNQFSYSMQFGLPI